MDNEGNVSQSGPGNGASSPVRALTRINPHKWSEERLLYLWNQLKTQDYAFDDPAREVGHAAFLTQLFAAGSEWYEIGDDGLAGVNGIIPKCNAVVHFVVWGDVEPRELFPLQHLLFNDLFTRYELNRLTAYIPAFNKQAIRMATIIGFRFEGELRRAFLSHGKYHNLQLYGLLQSEFCKRGEVRN